MLCPRPVDFALAAEYNLLRMVTMNTKWIVIVSVAAVVMGSSMAWAQANPVTTAPVSSATASDSRLDKILEQNEKILKNQEEILQRLDKLETSINQMRRRSS